MTWKLNLTNLTLDYSLDLKLVKYSLINTGNNFKLI